MFPPYAPYTNADVQGDPLHPPYPTPHHTSNTRIICLLHGGRTQLRHRRIDRPYLDFGCSRRTAVCGQVANWCPYVVCTYLGGGVYTNTCCSYGVVWGVEGGRGLPFRRHSHGGHRPELCRASDWLENDKKLLEVKQSRQTRVYLGYIRPKTGTLRFGPMAGLSWGAFLT